MLSYSRMSYDIFLHSKHDKNKSITTEFWTKLQQELSVESIDKNTDGSIKNFYGKYKGESPAWVGKGFEYYQQDNGDYVTSISYSATDEMLQYGIKLSTDIAAAIDFTIYDPQFSDESLSPEEYANQTNTSLDIANRTRRFTQGIATNLITHPLFPHKPIIISPASMTYFTQYLVYSNDPETDLLVILLQGNQTYCSKVERGEKLQEVMDREIPLLTGSSEYRFLEIGDGGSARNKHGDDLPRFNLIIAVPYFDPKSRNLIQPSSWVKIN